MKDGKIILSKYPEKVTEWQDLGMGIGLTVIAAYLFYRSVYGIFCGIFIVPLVIRSRRKKRKAEAGKQLEAQFLSAIQILSGALGAGYSLENAWKIVEQDLGLVYGTQAELCKALKDMNRKAMMQESIEVLFYEYAWKTGKEDLCNFAEIMRFAKRSGGNVSDIIGKTSLRMQEKAEILEDIRVSLASKKMEQKVLSIMFPGILCFLTITSPEYLRVLYGNVWGICIMTGCLAGYIGINWWAQRIMDIEV